MNNPKQPNKRPLISDKTLATAAGVAGVAGTAMEAGAIYSAHQQVATAAKKVASTISGPAKTLAIAELKNAKRGRLFGALGLGLGAVELLAAKRMHNNASKNS